MKSIPGNEDEETLLDPRDRYNENLENMIAKKKQGISLWGHVFMVVLLLTIASVYLKNNYLFTNESYSYLVALALPVAILTLLLGVIVYTKYLSKLMDSHRTVYLNCMAVLIISCICFVVFVSLLSIYFNQPKENKEYEFYSVIPYFVALILVSIFFIYVSPGLLDKQNGIEMHRFLIICVYLLFLAVYPIIYLLTST